MRFHALALACLASLAPSLSACGNEGEYQVAVSWLINGTTPNAAMCQEQNIARGRLEVASGGGGRSKVVEGPCEGTVVLSNNATYGGFYTNDSFEWDRTYDFEVSLVDSTGTMVSTSGSGQFYVAYAEADIYELNYLDYVQPNGRSSSLTAEWGFASGTASTVASDCQAQRVTKVRILATSALVEPLPDGTVPELVPITELDCAAGRFVSDGPVLATGNFHFVLQAISDTGAVANQSALQTQFVDFDQAIVLQRATFFAN